MMQRYGRWGLLLLFACADQPGNDPSSRTDLLEDKDQYRAWYERQKEIITHEWRDNAHAEYAVFAVRDSAQNARIDLWHQPQKAAEPVVRSPATQGEWIDTATLAFFIPNQPPMLVAIAASEDEAMVVVFHAKSGVYQPIALKAPAPGIDWIPERLTVHADAHRTCAVSVQWSGEDEARQSTWHRWNNVGLVVADSGSLCTDRF